MQPLCVGPLTPLELQILGCSYLVDENANRIPAGRNKVSSHSIAAVYHYVTKSHEVRARMHMQLVYTTRPCPPKRATGWEARVPPQTSCVGNMHMQLELEHKPGLCNALQGFVWLRSTQTLTPKPVNPAP